MAVRHKLAVVVREDLALSRGKLAAQVGHAAVSCALKASKKERKAFRTWMDQGQRKVVLRVPTLDELRDLEARASALGLVTELVSDAGLTEVPPGTTTCLGIGPGPEDRVDRVTGQLGLLR